MASRTSRGYLRSTSMIGMGASVPVSLTRWKAGDSYSRSRTNRPTAIRTALSRNGARQPQDRNASSEVVSWTIRNTTVDRNRPAGTPIWGQLPKKPRRPGGALDRHQHRPAPLAAHADALGDAQGDQDDRGPDADGVIGRHQPDEEGGDAHDEQRQHQHGLAADAVAEVAEDDPAQGAGREADAVGGQGQQRARGRLHLGEEQLVEDQRGGGAVEEEVVPLDGGADEAGRHDLPDRAPLGYLVVRAHRAASLWALDRLISTRKTG